MIFYQENFLGFFGLGFSFSVLLFISRSLGYFCRLAFSNFAWGRTPHQKTPN